MPILDRRAARVLLLDPVDRLLLFHGRDPGQPSAGTWWFTPGGGLDAGESPQDGAARELLEETGLVVTAAALGEVIHERITEFGFGGQQYRQAEEYFLLRLDEEWVVDTAGFNAIETASVLGHRWWSRPELASTSERIYPGELLELLQRVA